MKIIEAPQFGPMFRFNDGHVYWALHLLSKGERIGRKHLADLIGVGEGSMRRIIETLKEWNFIDVRQSGISIAPGGLAFLEQIPMTPVDIPILPGSMVGMYSQGVLVRGVSGKVKNGMEQRDAGIKVGASGCTTLVIRDGMLMIPPDWNLDAKEPEAARAIRATGMTDQDVLIIGTGDNPLVAIEAAINAAFELI